MDNAADDRMDMIAVKMMLQHQQANVRISRIPHSDRVLWRAKKGWSTRIIFFYFFIIFSYKNQSNQGMEFHIISPLSFLSYSFVDCSVSCCQSYSCVSFSTKTNVFTNILIPVRPPKTSLPLSSRKRLLIFL